jgi:hypothetical protein
LDKSYGNEKDGPAGKGGEKNDLLATSKNKRSLSIPLA